VDNVKLICFKDFVITTLSERKAYE